MAAENRNLMTTVLLVLSSVAFNTASGPSASTPSSAAAATGPAPLVSSSGASETDFRPMFNQYVKERTKTEDAGMVFLIATVPDPLGTHLSIYFDRAIESIQNAASTAGYSFDRYWVPWRDAPVTPSADPTISARQDAERRLREKSPGLLLFRGPAADKDSAYKATRQYEPDLAVFLIGETPTAGISAQQFDTAAGLILKTQHANANAAPILVAGPNFSGSLRSLASAIVGIRKSAVSEQIPAPVFHVVSGSTTSGGAQLAFRREVPDFYSTVHPDNEARCAFLVDLAVRATGSIDRGELDDDLKVAFLSEGDTSFGADFRTVKDFDPKQPNQGVPLEGDTSVVRNPEKDQKKTAAAAKSKQEAPKLGVPLSQICKTPDKAGAVNVLEFTFPRDIARLRNAYHEDSLAAPASGAVRAGTPEGVPLSLKDPNTGHDNVPSFSHEHTPTSQESVLQNLAAALRNNEVQYVGIVATDPLDAFFLERFLTNDSPGIRLFQLDSDLLFVHTPESLPLTGSLSITTYPLFAQNQRWTNPQSSWRLFSSRYSQGLYNATLALLGNHLPPGGAKDQPLLLPLLDPIKQGSIQERTPLLEYRSPFSAQLFRPSLWLTAIGRSAYWPIALLGSEGYKEPVVTLEEPGHLFLIVALLFGMVPIAFAVALWRARGSVEAGLSEFRSRAKSHRSIYILSFTVSLFGAYLCLAGPLWRLFPLNTGSIGESWLALAPCLLFAACAYFLADVFRAHRKLAVTTWVLFALFVIGGAVVLLSQDRTEGFFVAYRSVSLASGLSAAVPLIVVFVAYAVWARMHWRRRILIEERTQIAVRLDGTKLESASHQIGAAISEVHFGWQIFLPTAAVGVLAGWACLSHLKTLEPRTYDWMYSMAIGLLCSKIFLTAFRFVNIWHKLERFLEELELHPIRFALSDLPSDRSWSPIWQSNVSKRSHTLLARSVDCLRAMDPRYPKLQALSRVRELVVEHVALGKSESLHQIRAMRISVFIANRLAHELGNGYWREGSWESKSVGARGTSKRSALAAEFISLRLMAYIRYVMLHLSNLLGFLISGFILGLLSLHSYPFQSPQIIGTFSIVVFVALAAAVVWVFMRMSENPTLKRITSTEGKGDWNVWIKLAEAGALPLLAVISSSIPGAGRFLFSWLGPVLDKLH